jgi:hypothetical protein
MADLTVSVSALRGAADRIEDAARALTGLPQLPDLPPQPGGPGELLARRYTELHAEHADALTALVDRLREDAARLRTNAHRYEDTEWQNTIALR